MVVIPVLKRLSQEDSHLNAGLDYVVSSWLVGLQSETLSQN